MKQGYDWILAEYPETISKEQMYKLCHISKRTALYLLDSGLVPARNTGKETHRYAIATADVVRYLKARKRDPAKFQPPANWYRDKNKPPPGQPLYALIQLKNTAANRERLAKWLAHLPDALRAEDVRHITGYGHKKVDGWFHSGLLPSFNVRGKMLIPKAALIAFMLSTEFGGIRVAKEHEAALRKEMGRLK